MNNFVSRKKVLEKLGISKSEFYHLIKNGKFETIKLITKSIYNLKKYMLENNIIKDNKDCICYCRVSSNKQKEDLKRQVEYMEKRYPDNIIIKDIGSGLNYKKKDYRK